MRVDSYGLKNLKKILKEHDRGSKNYKNEVDVSRSALNYILSVDGNPLDAISIYEHARKRVAEIMGERPVPANTNYVSEWLLTYPASLCDTVKDDTGREYHVPKDPEHCREFFNFACYVLCERYGAENFLGAWVHMDETTPHMHFCFVPEATSRKTGKKTVSSASLLTKKELSGAPDGCQGALARMMVEEFGEDAKDWILNGRTKGGYSLEELKQRTKDEKALSKREKAVKQRENRAESREQALNVREQALNEREQALDEEKKSIVDYAKWLDDIKAQFDSLYEDAKRVIKGISDRQAKNTALNEIEPEFEAYRAKYKASGEQGKSRREKMNEASRRAREAKERAERESAKVVQMPVKMPTSAELRGYEAEAELGTFGQDIEHDKSIQ